MSNLEFKIVKSEELTEEERNTLVEAYRNLFVRIYNYDIVDSIVKVTNKDLKEVLKRGRVIKCYAENYQRALDAVSSTEESEKFDLFLIFGENGELLGGGRFYRISPNEASIPDIATVDLPLDEVREIWKQAIIFAESHFIQNGYSKMYLEIPLSEGPLLVRAIDMGFSESPEDIVTSPATRTYLLNKYLERLKMMNQILVVNKEKGLTSRDVVNKLNKILNTKKIGHTGTLDPLASGVLVCLTGKYTKLVSMITSLEKEYIATIKLGIKTDTLDITGNIIETNKPKKISTEDIINTFHRFIGIYDQIVPLYSAVRVKGKKMYEYARNNENVEQPKRKVEIKEIELLDYNNDYIKFRVLVSKGTYIRSLINDICDDLGVIGTMSDLVRTRQGTFNIKDAYTIEDIINNNYHEVKLEEALDLNVVYVDDNLYKRVINGNKIIANYEGFILFKLGEKDIALYYFENQIGRLKILF